MLRKDFLIHEPEILVKAVSRASGKEFVLAGDIEGVRGEVGLREGWGKVDEVCNSDRCNIVVVCVFVSNKFIILFTLVGLSNTRRFASVRVGEVFIVVIGEIVLTVVIIEF
jgi:hypothetical protein